MENQEESTLVQAHLPCPTCGSHAGLSVYSDGHSYCHSCKAYLRDQGVTANMANNTRKLKDPIPQDSLDLEPLKARGITSETCRKFSYYKATYEDKPVQVACYFEDNQVTGQKVRWANKDFKILGTVGDIFYGQWLFPGGGKKLVVTEGEIDCLTVSQLFQNKYPVVSIPKGSGSAKKVFKAQLEWLETFEEVITIFDMDEAGRLATKSVQGLLSPGKLKSAILPLKDPNECLLAGKAEEVIRSIWNAKAFRPDNIVNASELWDRITKSKEETASVPLPWNIALNRMTKGIRPAEIVLITAGSGIGKTTMVRAIAHYLGTVENIKVGMLMLEESPERTAEGLMSITAGKPLHLEDSVMSQEDRKKIFDEVLGPGNFVLYDHFGSLEGDNLINQMRYMAISEGCKFLILDHISIAISGLEGENERRIIDILMTKLASLTQETGVGIILISHLRKTDGKGKSHEEGGKITLDDLRGSGALKQLSFTVIALERNQQEEDPRLKNVCRVRLLKCRHTGQTGLAGHLYYDGETDQLVAIDDLDIFLGITEGDTLEDTPF